MPAPAAATTARYGGAPPHVYLKTYGAKVARLHLSDWVALVLLIAIDGALNLIEPFHRFIGEDTIPGLRYPLKENTVPVWAVPVLAVVGPMLVVVGMYVKRRNVCDLHHAVLGKSSAARSTLPFQALKLVQYGVVFDHGRSICPSDQASSSPGGGYP